MPPKFNKTNTLIVEGKDDQWSVINLVKHHVSWSDDAPPVFVHAYGGIDEMLKPECITAYLKSRETRVLGMVLDADSKPQGRYVSLRNTCRDYFSGLPESLPGEGLIAEANGKRFGLWVMPDNVAEGKLETFLGYLVPGESTSLWRHAANAVVSARRLDAPFRGVDAAKAELHTWLAWQDPPGQPFGVALTAKILDPHSPRAQQFVRWFKLLYGL